jgi:CubicO group peptidase (beta-lactamase class C family)
MKHLKLIPLLPIIVLLINIPIQAQTAMELELQIDSIFSQYNDINKPGASVAVVKNGEIVFKKGYGSANLEYDIPTTPSTIFHIASVSKQFTVCSILLLAHEGKLSLDDDIRKYIPEVPDFGTTITLRHLATHTSGLRDQWNLLTMAGWRMDDVITKEHVLKLVAAQKELNFEPGEQYMYCNTGFTLLAEVVSRISGESFAAFTTSNIFEPLKMSNTLFYDDHEKIVKNRAYSYYADSTGYKKSVLSYANVGATSLFTTAEDLSLWAMNFSSLKVGNAALIKQMNTLAVLNNGETFGGAYGQFVNKYKGLNQIQHGGADAGYRSYLGRFPDQNFAVLVLSNYAATNSGRLSLQVADLYLKENFIPATPEANKKEVKYKKLKTKELQSFAADYWNEAGSYSRKIYVKNDTLMYFRGEGNESPLAPIGANLFQMLNVAVDLKVKFNKEDDLNGMIVTIDDGDPIVSDRYTPANYSSAELGQFTGVFYSDELSTAYTFTLIDDKLVASHSKLSDINLTPIRKDRFSGDRWFFSNIKFERDANNAITGIRVSSGRVTNLYFEKITH